ELLEQRRGIVLTDAQTLQSQVRPWLDLVAALVDDLIRAGAAESEWLPLQTVVENLQRHLAKTRPARAENERLLAQLEAALLAFPSGVAPDSAPPAPRTDFWK